ncbi:hypothetical protein CMI47_17010 [Candidatus Pacearchaeota archaeon]|nr:hypothetical protein [Candidatus Pacearchaeota archaeon]|tara:strand:+ start:11574 stop:13277 length:1704 start_codon:yes stop_codon:yes gene_type:complete
MLQNTLPPLTDLIKYFSHNSFKGMQITFINMPLRETAAPNVPPEGPGILAAIVRQCGAQPYILDLNAYRIKDEIATKRNLPNGRHLSYTEAEALIVKHLKRTGDQDVIAFSGKITTLRWQEEIAKIVRKHQPDCFLVTGNGLATEIKTGLFKWIPELDGIGRSEGDDIILLILKDAKTIKELGTRKATLSGKLSPFYIGEIGGKSRFCYEGNRPMNLDAIPYAAWDLLESDPYGHNVLEDYIKVPVWGIAANNSSATPFEMKRSLTTVSSRGCPYSCAFCYRGAQGERNYGMRSSEHIAQQIKGYVDKYSLDFIGFPDDNFAVDRRRTKQMVPVFKEYGLDEIRWGTHTRMDEADDRIFDMAASGCVYIGFGAESASEHTLTVMKKGGFILKNGLTPKKINGKLYQFPTTMVTAVENCKKANVHGNCTWIMAFPGEELEHLKTSVAFIKWQQEFWSDNFTVGTTEYENAVKSVNATMFTATAYPGTEMWRMVKPQLTEHFGITYNVLGEPVCDENFHNYVLELDDATKVLNDIHGMPVNFGNMPMDVFLQARQYVDSGQIEKVLDME